ncbi:hypothetical protein [Vibrio crassostreae]|uniref:hypothetical protein n=1 Tax=Vibrio crassostreae TaxID=246167 RepID=UPI001B307740|nr:hypothetical protein [Vibrio crassostreae]
MRNQLKKIGERKVIEDTGAPCEPIPFKDLLILVGSAAAVIGAAHLIGNIFF